MNKKCAIPSTMEEAKDVGWIYYMDHSICDKGHRSGKYTADGKCIKCRDEEMVKARAEGEKEINKLQKSRKMKLYRRRRKDREKNKKMKTVFRTGEDENGHD